MGAFQIGALDTAVCALWAVCRHWQDPKAAVIAAVRGVPHLLLLHCTASTV